MQMLEKLTHVTVLVADQDEALAFYTGKLGCVKRRDETFGETRWLTVAPPNQAEVEIVLLQAGEPGGARPAKDERIGQNAMWVLSTSDCRAISAELAQRGVHFLAEPESVPWGVQSIFIDLYGNPYCLVEPSEP